MLYTWNKGLPCGSVIGLYTKNNGGVGTSQQTYIFTAFSSQSFLLKCFPGDLWNDSLRYDC